MSATGAKEGGPSTASGLTASEGLRAWRSLVASVLPTGTATELSPLTTESRVTPNTGGAGAPGGAGGGGGVGGVSGGLGVTRRTATRGRGGSGGGGSGSGGGAGGGGGGCSCTSISMGRRSRLREAGLTDRRDTPNAPWRVVATSTPQIS